MNERGTESQDAAQDSPQETMTFLEHLEELRQRLIKCIIAVVVGVFVCWFFREELRQFLEAPLYTAWESIPGLPAPSPLSFKSLMEPFVAYLKIAAIGGVFFASPVIFYHLWRFVSPGLYSKEKKFALPFVFISSALFMLGSAGAYAYVFPIGFSFFLQFSSGGNVETLQSDPVAILPTNTNEKKAEKQPSAPKTAPKETVPNIKKDTPEDQRKNSATKSKATPKRAIPRPPQSRTSEKSNKWAQLQKAYQWVQNKLMGENCGELNTFPTPKSIRVEYRFDTKRCGPKPTAISAQKSRPPLPIKMETIDETKGIVTYSGFDHNASATPAQYEVTVVHAAAQKLAPVLMVKDYLDFAVKLLFAFGLVFELPVLIFFLAFAGIVNYKQLIHFGRWFVVLSVTFAAFLTPPDVVTQIMLATPLVVLYYLSVLVVFLLDRKRSSDE